MINFFALHRQYAEVGEELEHVTCEVLKSGKFMGGIYTHMLENWLCKRTGAAAAVLCHSGTQALEFIARYKLAEHKNAFNNNLAFIPNFTFPATAHAFVRAGYNLKFLDVDDRGIAPHFVDNEQEGYAVKVGVGLYGANTITHDVEDAAQHWLTIKHLRYNSMAAVSFDPTKNLSASGNGGAILIGERNKHLEQMFRKLIANKDTDYNHYKIRKIYDTPTNSRMSEIDAAHVWVRSQYIDTWQSRRRTIAEYWNEQFRELPVNLLIDLQDVSGRPLDHQIQKYVIATAERDQLKQHLSEWNIETRIHYEQVLSLMPQFEGYLTVKSGVENSKRLAREVLSLPIYPELTDSEVEYIGKAIKAFY